jgi:hypothetical protein
MGSDAELQPVAERQLSPDFAVPAKLVRLRELALVPRGCISGSALLPPVLLAAQQTGSGQELRRPMRAAFLQSHVDNARLADLDRKAKKPR